jgi:hypothetical protein
MAGHLWCVMGEADSATMHCCRPRMGAVTFETSFTDEIQCMA